MPLRKDRVLSGRISEAAKAASPEEQIRLRAYMLYVEHGRKDGFALDDWLQAEAEILGSPVAVGIVIRPEDIESSKGEYEQAAGDADSVYRVVSWILTNRWGHIKEIVDAITVILVVWNRSFYGPRGQLNRVALESWLQDHLTVISLMRERPIATLSARDEPVISELFDTLLVATEVAFGDRKGEKSAVSVAKALQFWPQTFCLHGTRQSLTATVAPSQRIRVKRTPGFATQSASKRGSLPRRCRRAISVFSND
jgi:Protein of unknown function (DUF2934)